MFGVGILSLLRGVAPPLWNANVGPGGAGKQGAAGGDDSEGTRAGDVGGAGRVSRESCCWKTQPSGSQPPSGKAV